MYTKRFIIVLIVSLAVCYTSSRIFDARYKKNFATLYFNSLDSITDKSKQYDIIFLGDSRIHFGLNPYYTDSVTALSAYNFGVGGSDAAMLQLMGKLYLQNHEPPGYVVIGAGNSMVNPVLAEDIQYHLLYYLKNPLVYDYYSKMNRSVVMAKYLPFLKYCFFNEYNRAFLFKKMRSFNNFNHNVYKGFINDTETNNSMHRFAAPVVKPIDTTSIAMVKALVLQYKSAGSKVIIVSPPRRDHISEVLKNVYDRTDSIFSAVATQCGVYYYKAGIHQKYDDIYFTDEGHLNEPGTRIFSTETGIFLRDSIIKKQPHF
ncbi:MAG: hypothetical protein QM687_14660 [Ferruginibacter sp.]